MQIINADGKLVDIDIFFEKVQKGIQGFIGTTYTVYKDYKLLKICMSKNEAEEFINDIK